MNQLLSTWNNLDLQRRIVLLGAIGLTFLAVLSLAQVATRPAMALLYSGLDPAAAGEVVGSLEQMNVQAEIRGDAIYVHEDARDRVRLALAREGLPRQGQAGYELLDAISGFSATTDMFNAAYWRAKEGELARTILASPGVRAARVHIAVPNRRPFAGQNAEPTASVSVTMAGGRMTVEQATSIRYMTALAVASLSPDQVAVIDSRAGMILAPGSESAIASAATQAAERESKLKSEIEDLIAARVGRDRARVSVTVETDREAETITERVIQPDSRVTIHSDTEEISDSAQGASGAVTVASNLPTGDAANDNTRQSARTETRERINYDYSELRRETSRAAGTIRKISVAVLVDGINTTNADGESVWQERPQEELEALRELVIAAVGFDEQRGDVVTVESMAFQPDATPGASIEVSPVMRFFERNALTFIQLAVLAVVALILGLTVVKPLLSRAPSGALATGSEIELATAGATVDDFGNVTQPLDANAPQVVEPEIGLDDQLRTIAADQPEQTAAMLKIWLEDPETGNGEKQKDQAA
ncbi:MAG: flagellar basal-body MS-ring/collar protein FliF [Pseudomonadota bacterium]